MVRRESLKAAETQSLLAEAVLGVQIRKYKSSYEAAKQLGLYKETIVCRVNRRLTCV